MTLPVFRPLIISATFVICSTFAGSSFATEPVICPQSAQRIVNYVGHLSVCSSRELLPSCPDECRATKFITKTLLFDCTWIRTKPGKEEQPGDKYIAYMEVQYPEQCISKYTMADSLSMTSNLQ